MRIIVAETAGFCMGVGLALNKLDGVVECGGKPIFTLGPIIHNPQVLQSYVEKGVHSIEDPDEAPSGSSVVIRAHGIPRETEQQLIERGVRVVDATCPKVKRAQVLIDEFRGSGRQLLLYGEENHPEVKGLLSYAEPGALVFDTPDELKDCLKPGGKYFLAAQTTQDRAWFKDIRNYLLSEVDPEMPVLETICDATKIRQEEAVAVADEVDCMVVVGGRNSGNTRRLVKVVEGHGVPCTHVETAKELDSDFFSDCNTLGLTAGASTPKAIIQEVYDRLLSINAD